MKLARWIGHQVVPRKPSQWAVEIARQCYGSVAVRLGQSLFRMSLPEARGYIRSRAAAVLDEEIATFLQRTGCRPALAMVVREKAAEEIVRMAIGNLLKATRPAASYRKAA